MRMHVPGGFIYFIRELGDYGHTTVGLTAVFVPYSPPFPGKSD